MSCVVVPIYKEFVNLSDGELLSLRRLYKVLGKHQIILLGAKGFCWETYLNDAQLNGISLSIKEFNGFYFSSVSEYNRLLLSYEFYIEFKKWNYILIYQLDAWVFRDELDFWCEKSFDYIGAPWFEGYAASSGNLKFMGVGNGGFSLRNVQKALKILRRIKRIRSYRRFWYKYKLQAVVRFENLLKYFPFVHSKNKLTHLPEKLWEVNGLNEDVFWTRNVPSVFNDFKVSDIENAIKFSFEVNPSFLFEKNNFKLPFGCHAWEKYEPEFWDTYMLEQKNE